MSGTDEDTSVCVSGEARLKRRRQWDGGEGEKALNRKRDSEIGVWMHTQTDRENDKVAPSCLAV